MTTIPIAIIGLGNCATALLEGIQFFRDEPEAAPGTITDDIGGYRAVDIEPVVAFDVDREKVGKSIGEAAELGNQRRMKKPLDFGGPVEAGTLSDGLSATSIVEPVRWDNSVDMLAQRIADSGARIAVNYLPVGSTDATAQYTEAALRAGVAFVNCIPVRVARDPEMAARFEEANIPLVGDDIKSQYGATIIHRALARTAEDRGITILDTYQLNFGGNADFRNMLDQTRLADKKESKTQSVTDVATIDEDRVHITPAGHVPYMGDEKVAYIHMAMTGFAGAPLDLECRIRVYDSPNSAGVVVDAVRHAATAADEGRGGVLDEVSAFLMKAPRNHGSGDQPV